MNSRLLSIVLILSLLLFIALFREGFTTPPINPPPRLIQGFDVSGSIPPQSPPMPPPPPMHYSGPQMHHAPPSFYGHTYSPSYRPSWLNEPTYERVYLSAKEIPLSQEQTIPYNSILGVILLLSATTLLFRL